MKRSNRENTMKHVTRLLGGAITGLILSISTAQAECGKVTISEMDWASSAIVTSVASFLMEQGYGCDVTKVRTSTVPALASAAETGEPEIVTEMWPAVATAYKDMEAADKMITVTEVLPDGGVDGWWIPDYLAEAHPELKTLDGILANPGLVGGRFHNCPVGWGCRVSNDNLVQAFDLAGHGIEVFNHGSGETLATSIASAYTNKEPWFGYYWAPTPVLGKYNMVAVDMGPVDPEIAACNARKDCATPGKTGWPTATVLTTVTPAFAEKEPEIVELLKHMQFSNDMMGSLLAWQEDNSATADETAVHFLNSNKEIWREWLNDDAREKLSGLLQ